MSGIGSRMIRLCLLVAGAAFAALPSLADPLTPATGVALTQALNLIVREIGQQGPVDYVASAHDAVTHEDAGVQVDTLASHVSADPTACKISYHWKIIGNGAVVGDQDREIALAAVTDVHVRAGVEGPVGQPPLATTPPVFVVLVRQGEAGNAIYFRDPDVADRVAAALTRAAKLCGAEPAPS
jgi:hypothetical protein